MSQPKRCNWCQKRLRAEYKLLICPNCIEELIEMLRR